MSVTGVQRWQACHSDVTEWREWGDELVVYDGLEANTHLLSAAAGLVWLALREAQRTVSIEELAADLLGGAVDDAAALADSPVAATGPFESSVAAGSCHASQRHVSHIAPDDLAALALLLSDLERIGLVESRVS